MAKELCLMRYCGSDVSLQAFLACKLISLDKNPGVRPIGIGEVIRWILVCTVMRTFRRNILESAGDLQFCAGQGEGHDVKGVSVQWRWQRWDFVGRRR